MKNALYSLLAQRPALFYPLYRLAKPPHLIKECCLSPEKELVIEGFPRSANTFAVVAFRQAQGMETPMAHHLHSEAQVLAGVKRELPVMVLIRHPFDAVRSLLIRQPNIGARDAFKRWTNFYEAASKVKEQILIAEFSQVTSNFGAVIDQLNSRFGTTYRPFSHTGENVQLVYREIEKVNNEFDSGRETHVARPSGERQQLYQKSIMTRNSDELTDRALRIFVSLTGRERS